MHIFAPTILYFNSLKDLFTFQKRRITQSHNKFPRQTRLIMPCKPNNSNRQALSFFPGGEATSILYWLNAQWTQILCQMANASSVTTARHGLLGPANANARLSHRIHLHVLHAMQWEKCCCRWNYPLISGTSDSSPCFDMHRSHILTIVPSLCSPLWRPHQPRHNDARE